MASKELPYIFISYAHADAKRVLPLIHGLQKQGFRIWYDSRIAVGAEWSEFIADRLLSSSCVIAFLSPAAVHSPNCRREIHYSISNGKDPLCVYLEDTRLSPGLEMQLCVLHAAHLNRYESTEHFLKTFSEEKLLQPCRGTAAVEQAFGMSDTVQLYLSAALQGDAHAQRNLAACYESGIGTSPNMEEALHWYHQAAMQNDAKAQHYLALCYEYGKGVTVNLSEAFLWYRRAAEQGFANAQCSLGICYEQGKGVERDVAQAVKYYQLSAAQGYPSAYYDLGLCYEYGKAVDIDLAEAVRWYAKGAKVEDPGCCFHLGLFYEFNKGGIGKDLAEAARLYRIAAEQGTVSAMYALGLCYEFGKTGAKDLSEAAHWYAKGAEQSDPGCCYRLGQFHEHGTGDVVKDLNEAIRLYRIAAKQDFKDAHQRLQQLGESL